MVNTAKNSGFYITVAPKGTGPKKRRLIMALTRRALKAMVWVSGESEAMAYLVAPNSAVALWDSNAPTIYLKQADASGKPSIKVYDLVERTSGARTAQSPQGVEFATKADLEALAARVDALAAPKTTAKKNAKEDAE